MKIHPVLQHMLRQGVHPQVVQNIHRNAQARAQMVFKQALAQRMMHKQATRAARGR